MDRIAQGGTLLKQNHEAEQPPTCFGKMFDGNSAECVGGHDPAFYNKDPNSKHYGTQTRDNCDWVGSCSARMQATQQVIPVSSLNRQQPPSPFATKFNPPTQPQPQPWRPPQQYTPPHLQQHGGNQMMAVNFGIPQYLTVREPHTGGFGARLVRESFRSMLKSIGHTFAHFFDVEIVGSPPPGGGNQRGE